MTLTLTDVSRKKLYIIADVSLLFTVELQFVLFNICMCSAKMDLNMERTRMIRVWIGRVTG